jgi:hypothetical protein
MKENTYRLIFILGVMGMFFLVIGSWIWAHYTLPLSSSYDGAEDYPVQLSYTEYRQYVEEKLGNDDLYIADITGDASVSGSWLESINNKIINIEGKIERYSNAKGICQKYVFINAQKYVMKLAGVDMTIALSAQTNDLTDATDIVVETVEGQLGYVQDDVDISESLDNLIAFGLDIEAEGRNFIWFQNPNKYADSIPYTDYSEKYYGEITAACEKYGIDRYDCGAALTALGMTESDIFYNTDHHWKPSTGILADKLLCEYLNENYGYDIELSNFEMDQYTTETYEGLFLGSLGRKVTSVYAKPDDFIIYTPRYDTYLNVYDSTYNVIRTGTVGETLFDYDAIKDYQLYTSNAYALYGYGDQALLKIHNNLLENGSHILLIKTSFGDCMVPYLATVVEDLDTIDLRAFDGSIRSYIEESNPDTVIVIEGLSLMESDSAEETAFDYR